MQTKTVKKQKVRNGKMDKEIKFRGKRVDNGEWAYGWLVDVSCANANKPAMRIVKQLSTGLVYLPVLPETVGQYINAKICQGDILKAKYEDLLGIEREIIGVVEIGEFEVMLDIPNYGITIPLRCLFTDELEDYEILGNETDNPELLERESK